MESPTALLVRADVVRVILERSDPGYSRPSARQRESFRRSVLAGALGVEGERLAFEKDPRGRPRVGGALAGEVAFSCASTRGVMTIAFGRSGRIGVDVERRNAAIVDDALCAAALEAGELGYVEKTRGGATAFFEIWTRKEAVMKAAGRGLRWDPRGVFVCGRPDADGWIQARTPDTGTWWVRSLPAFDDCDVAVAADRRVEVNITHRSASHAVAD